MSTTESVIGHVTGITVKKGILKLEIQAGKGQYPEDISTWDQLWAIVKSNENPDRLPGREKTPIEREERKNRKRKKQHTEGINEPPEKKEEAVTKEQAVEKTCDTCAHGYVMHVDDGTGEDVTGELACRMGEEKTEEEFPDYEQVWDANGAGCSFYEEKKTVLDVEDPAHLCKLTNCGSFIFGEDDTPARCKWKDQVIDLEYDEEHNVLKHEECLKDSQPDACEGCPELQQDGCQADICIKTGKPTSGGSVDVHTLPLAICAGGMCDFFSMHGKEPVGTCSKYGGEQTLTAGAVVGEWLRLPECVEEEEKVRAELAATAEQQEQTQETSAPAPEETMGEATAMDGTEPTTTEQAEGADAGASEQQPTESPEKAAEEEGDVPL